MRLHLLALPHTITTDAFSHCAFTGKIKRFSPMMRSVGFEVFHYGVEGAESGADREIDVLSRGEWSDLRLKSLLFLRPEMSEEDAKKRLEDQTAFIGELGDISTPLYAEFNRRLRDLLRENYRSNQTDIVCLPFGKGHEEAVRGSGMVCVETGIGYHGSFLPYRVFESHAWLNYHLGKEKKDVQAYWFVCPNYYRSVDWPLSLRPTPTVGFLGRIYDGKGCREIQEIARRMPHVRFVLCGQGDPHAYSEPNLEYLPPIHGVERAAYLGSLAAYLAPSRFVEPFCGAAVEAQLCGTPVICADAGAFGETVEHGKTGVRCHTLQDYCEGIQMALDGKFDRAYVRERAVARYDMGVVARTYEYIFRNILNLYLPGGGWYSSSSFLRSPEVPDS